MSYWSDWRARHPEYRHREVARLRERRRLLGRESRVTEFAHAKAKRGTITWEPIPALFVGHPIFDAARAIVPMHRSPGTTLQFEAEQWWEEEMSEAVLALLEGRDPAAAAKAVLHDERAWSWRHAPLPDDDVLGVTSFRP